MALGTVVIAFCPKYATIGVAAPRHRAESARPVAGFSSAGVELRPGVSVYLSEIATPGNRGLLQPRSSHQSQQVANLRGRRSWATS